MAERGLRQGDTLSAFILTSALVTDISFHIAGVDPGIFYRGCPNFDSENTENFFSKLLLSTMALHQN